MPRLGSPGLEAARRVVLSVEGAERTSWMSWAAGQGGTKPIDQLVFGKLLSLLATHKQWEAHHAPHGKKAQ